MLLSLLLVEDDQEYLKFYIEDIPEIFSQHGHEVEILPISDFDKANDIIKNPCYKFDLLVSDTYKGDTRNGDAAVLHMIKEYRKSTFCPLVVFSSGSKPAQISESIFLKWADKSKENEVEKKISEILDFGLPQISRKIHSQMNGTSGKYLWDFLEKNWDQYDELSSILPDVFERMIRKRAAIQISEINSGTDKSLPINEKAAPEYYIYPALEHNYFSLGDVIRNKDKDKDNENENENENENDFRVILTPHCFLNIQKNQSAPKADHVLTVKTVLAQEKLGKTKLDNLKRKKEEGENYQDALSRWARSPSQTGKTPEGRYWYLPRFLEIPHLFCDFLMIESIEYGKLDSDYERIATLNPPYAEALQNCFASFYSSVGIPEIIPDSISSILDY